MNSPWKKYPSSALAWMSSINYEVTLVWTHMLSKGRLCSLAVAYRMAVKKLMGLKR